MKAARTLRLLVLGALAAATLVNLTGSASALGPCTTTWTGSPGSSWSTAANWSANAVPGAGDTVCLPAVSDVVLSNNTTIKELSVTAGGKLTLTSQLTIAKAAENAGTIVLDGASTDPELRATDNDGNTVETIANSGTIRTQGDEGAYYLAGDLTSSGQITSANGTLYLNRFPPESRAFTASSTGTVTATAGVVTSGLFVTNGGTVATTGSFVQDGGTLRAQGGATFSGAKAPRVQSGTLAFQSAGSATGALATSGNSNLTGTIPAGVTVTTVNQLTMTADAGNAGTLVLDGTDNDPTLRATDGDNTTAETFTNSGTIRTQGDDGNYYITTDLVSSGQVDVPVGTLFINRFNAESRAYTATSTGTITVASVAGLSSAGLVVLDGGTATTAGTWVHEGNGTLRVKGAVTLNGGKAPRVQSGTLAFEAATAATGALATSGNANLAGTIPAAVTVTMVNQLTIAADAGNAGTLVLDGIDNDPTLRATDGDNTTVETFTNTGTIRTQGDEGNYFITTDLVSSGQITSGKGTLFINRFNAETRSYTATSTGTVTVATGAALSAAGEVVNSGGTFATDGPYVQEGNGMLRATGAATFSGTTAPRVANGTLALTAGTTATGALATSGNTSLTGPALPSGVTLTVKDATTATGSLTLAGTVVLDGTDSDPTLRATDANDATTETITNTGTIRNQGDEGNYYLAADLVSTGRLSVTKGRLYLNRFLPENRPYATSIGSAGETTVAANAALETGGTVSDAGKLTVGAAGEVRGVNGYVRAGGTATLATGAGFVTGGAPLIDLQGGTLTTDSDATVGPLRNAASLTLGGAPGTLTVPGPFTQTGAGTLTVKVNGATADTDFDVVAASGALTLAGTLAVKASGSFVPVQDQRFGSLTGNARTGRFDATTSERAGQFEYRPDYGGQSVALRAQDVVAPDTTITGGPEDGAYTNDRNPVFTFVSNETVSTFQCSVDGAEFDACSGPGAKHQATNLADGEHTFAVWAIDQGDNPDRTFALRTFTVGAVPSGPVYGIPGPDLSGESPAEDRVAPALKVSGFKLSGARGARARVSCNEACSVLLDLTATVGKRRIQLGFDSVTLAKDKPGKLKLKVKRKARRRLKRAMRRGRPARVTAEITAFDTAGNGSKTYRRKTKARKA